MVVTRDVMIGVIVGRIAAVAVVIAVCVVVWIHRRHVVWSVWVTARRRRRHHRTIAVVVVAVVTRTLVVADTGTYPDDHPRFVVTTIPVEAYRLKVLERGEAVKLTVQLVVRHHRVNPVWIHAIGRNAYGDSLDPTGRHPHALPGVVTAIVGIKIDVQVTSVGIISDILNIIVDGDRIGSVGQHGL